MLKNKHPEFVSINSVDWNDSVKRPIENDLYCVLLCILRPHKAQRDFGEGIIIIQENKVKVLLI